MSCMFGSLKVKLTPEGLKLKSEMVSGTRLAWSGLLNGTGAERARGKRGRRREMAWSILKIVKVLAATAVDRGID